jgi:hypothetical protein
MASLLTSNDIKSFSEVLADHFDTFQRDIIIHKEPIKVINTINSNKTYAGYNDSSNANNFTFLPQSKTFPAIVVYENKQSEVTNQVGTFPIGMIKIKVKKEARDYILSGKTEKMEVDGKSFNVVTEDKVQNYLGLAFYIFHLQSTS